MPRWTRDQEQVIASEARELICSAAAGSGKTAVLVERVIRLIREGVLPDRFLIVTFTTAAAAEMKEKIRDRLRKEPGSPEIRRALDTVDTMEISTIHAFCQRLIRQEFQVVGIDPLFRICDAGLRRRLFAESFREACETLRGDPDFDFFRCCYDRNRTEELVSQVYSFMMSLPDPLDWLHRMCADVPETLDPTHRWFACAAEMIREKLYRAQTLLRRQLDLFDDYARVDAFREVWKADSELFHVKQCWTEGTAEGNPPTGDLRRLPSVRNLNQLEADWRDRYKEIREELRELNREIDLLMAPDVGRVSREMESIRINLRVLDRLTAGTAEAFARRKKAARVADFGDLEHFALKILREEPSRSAVRGRYEQIFVDECQDVSAVQDAILQALHGEGNSLFMVGDVKQSIYRFRLADPTLFLNRLGDAPVQARAENEKKDPSAESVRQVIFLRENFRSRPEILETANAVFRDLMRKETAEMDYTPRDELRPGRETTGKIPVWMDLISTEEENVPTLTALADHTAACIRELMEDGTVRGPEGRPLSLRDIVILMPQVSTDGPKMADLLRERGIPVFFDGGRDFFACGEVTAFRELLEAIDRPDQDVPLISALSNPPFFFTEEELAAVRLTRPEKAVPYWQAFEAACGEQTPLGARCREARDRLAEWRLRAETQRLSDFLWYLLGASSRYALARMEEDGEAVRANLRMLCDQARQAEETGVFTLRDFLGVLSGQAAAGDQRAAAPLGDRDELVRLMTMHKSKGLQFPVVFCLGLDHTLHGRPAGAAMLDAQLGICLQTKDPEQRISRKTLITDIFSWKKTREERAEKIRLLYVAMTRAQEMLILAGCGKREALWKNPPGPQRILAADTFLDLVVPPLLDAEIRPYSTSYPQGETPWKIRHFEANQQKVVEKIKVIHSLVSWVKSLASMPPVEEMWMNETERVTEKEPEILRKRSVTRLIRQAEETLPEETEETMEDKRIPERGLQALRRYDAGNLPAFMTGEDETLSGAARGILTHRFLSLVSLERLREGGDPALPERIRAEKSRVTEAGVFTAREAGEIREEQIAAFFRSDIGARMLAAETVRREWSFNLLVRERNLLVQGVADCVFREADGWVLLDYKTDRVENGEELLARYRPQLEWYALAVETLTGFPVKERWLYSLHLNRGFRDESGNP